MSLERTLQRAQRGMKKIILDITWRDRKRASWIREQKKVLNILNTIKRKNGHRQGTSCDEETIYELIE